MTVDLQRLQTKLNLFLRFREKEFHIKNRIWTMTHWRAFERVKGKAQKLTNYKRIYKMISLRQQTSNSQGRNGISIGDKSKCFKHRQIRFDHIKMTEITNSEK